MLQTRGNIDRRKKKTTTLQKCKIHVVSLQMKRNNNKNLVRKDQVFGFPFFALPHESSGKMANVMDFVVGIYSSQSCALLPALPKISLTGMRVCD